MKTQNIHPNYKSKLNGYRCSHRNRWYLIHHKILSVQAATLFDFYIDISDWDKEHLKFGLFEVHFGDIAAIFNCSPNTIRNWHAEIVFGGFIKATTHRGIFKLTNSERYIGPGILGGKAAEYAKHERHQPPVIIFDSIGLSPLPIRKNVKPIESFSNNNLKKTTPKALVSSKGDSSLSAPARSSSYQEDNQKPKDYHQVHKDGGFQNLTPEDMEWLEDIIK